MTVFRLASGLYKDDLTGKGAEIAGGRWNSKGLPLLYTAESRALCTAEIAVHLPLGVVPQNYFLISIRIPDSEILHLDQLPKEWKSFPYSQQTKEIGDRFIREEKSLILKVPSAVIAGDYNYLINPGHPMIRHVKVLTIEPYAFDDRLFKR